MIIEFGDFYFECERTVALIIAMTPIIALVQLPSVMRLVSRMIGRLGTGKRDGIEDRVRREEGSLHT